MSGSPEMSGSEMGEAEVDEDFTWKIELETALFEEAEIGSLRNIARGRPIPEHLRLDFWKACLLPSHPNKIEQDVIFTDLFDLPEQDVLRSDCQDLVERLGNDEEDQISVTSDLESLFTQYCKKRKMKYESSKGWMELVQPLIALRLEKEDIFRLFESLQTKYIPRDCAPHGAAPYLLRLLLLYHDPELCSFLDSKKVSPDLYASQWFKTLFASCCNIQVVFAMWDVYFQANDPFLVFFLALVILINARDQVIQMQENPTEDIAETLVQFPCALEADDIQDFCSLAQYYVSRTPQSYRQDYQSALFGAGVIRSPSNLNLDTAGSDADSGCDVSASSSSSSTTRNHSLCLSVSVPELLQAAQADTADAVRFFVVDCRSPDRYNLGHLSTAFHLDASLMLQDPKEFTTAVNVLFAAQKQAISAGSRAGGEHLCFMGSGILDDDQEYNMVVANFLQKNTLFVSVVQGGWEAVVKFLNDARSPRLISNHTVGSLISANDVSAASVNDASSAQNPESESATAPPKTGSGDAAELFGFKRGMGFINKLASPTTSNQLKEKFSEMKTKLADYITNSELMASGQEEERHITPSPGGKRYRNAPNVFSIDGDEDEEEERGVSSGGGVSSEDEVSRETVSLETWLNKSDVKHSFKCEQVKPSGYAHPSHILVTATHLYVLREMPVKKGFAVIQSRRPLSSIVKITSRKKIPELITFKFTNPQLASTKAEEELISERFLIPQAGEATKAIKLQIIDVLKLQEETTMEMGAATPS